MKFDFDFTMTSLDGVPMTDENGMELHAGRTAALLIMKSVDTGADIMTKYDWAQQLFKTGKIDLDKAGQQLFKTMILSMPNVWLSVRGQLAEVMDKRKEELEN
jgi:hypothetical protein